MNNVTKPIKAALAVFLKNPQNNKEFLIVKRPPDDESLPNVFGLPAVSITNNELPEEACKRVGKEKLNANIKPISFIGVKYIDRGSYILILMDLEAELISGAPNVNQSQTTGTKYVAQEWTTDYKRLVGAASKGSLCSQIILDREGIGY